MPRLAPPKIRVACPRPPRKMTPTFRPSHREPLMPGPTSRSVRIMLLRGLDKDKPVDSHLRGSAIRTMEQQEIRHAAVVRAAATSPVRSSALVNNPAWISIGPAPIMPGTGTSVQVSGRVTAIAVHPTAPQTIYVGAAQGGEIGR